VVKLNKNVSFVFLKLYPGASHIFWLIFGLIRSGMAFCLFIGGGSLFLSRHLFIA
jgi:hypothetical protein